MRLTQIGRNIGLVTDERYDRFMYKKDLMERSIRKLESSYASAPIMKKINGEDYSGSNSMLEILRRPEIALRQITSVMEFDEMDSDTMYAIEAEVKYKGYIEKQLRQVEQFRSLENRLLPQGYDYLSISGLSSEGKMKLQDLQPLNIGQASRISGVSPADISVLLIHFEKQRHE